MGLIVSVIFSLILVIQRSTQPRIKIIGRNPNNDEWVPIDEDDEAQEEIPGVVSCSERLECCADRSSLSGSVRVSPSPTRVS